MNCIIIEDQPPAQRILTKYITSTNSLNLTGCFYNIEMAEKFIENNTVDLIFLDIHLPKISGIDYLRTTKIKSNIILTTAYSKYALESYEYKVVDYLLKPISKERFTQAINKIDMIKEISETIMIKSGYDFIKIKMSDIVYIKSDSDYTEIITPQKTHLSNLTLKQWIEKLNNTTFFRVHKSYIVNLEKLNKVVSNSVYLFNDIELPIGRAYKKVFIQQITTTNG